MENLPVKRSLPQEPQNKRFRASLSGKKPQHENVRVEFQNVNFSEITDNSFALIVQDYKNLKSVLTHINGFFSEDFEIYTKQTASSLESVKENLPILKIAKDLQKTYDVEYESKVNLQSKINDIQTKLHDKKQNHEKIKSQLSEQKATLRAEFKRLARDKETQEKESKTQIETNQKIVEFYSSLSGIDITEEGSGKFKVKVRWMQEEFGFLLVEEEDTFWYEMISSSTENDKIPDLLKEEINIEKKYAPVLLHKILNLLN